MTSRQQAYHARRHEQGFTDLRVALDAADQAKLNAIRLRYGLPSITAAVRFLVREISI